GVLPRSLTCFGPLDRRAQVNLRNLLRSATPPRVSQFRHFSPVTSPELSGVDHLFTWVSPTSAGYARFPRATFHHVPYVMQVARKQPKNAGFDTRKLEILHDIR